MQQVLVFLEVLGSGYGSLLKADLVIFIMDEEGFCFCFVFETFFAMNQDICVPVYLWISLWFG